MIMRRDSASMPKWISCNNDRSKGGAVKAWFRSLADQDPARREVLALEPVGAVRRRLTELWRQSASTAPLCYAAIKSASPRPTPFLRRARDIYILFEIIEFARRPDRSTCSPPRTVRSRCPPRMRPNDIALAPGSAVTGRPPASVSVGRAMPSSGVGPVAIRPFSAWNNTWDPFGHVVGDLRQNSNAEIDEHTGTPLSGDAACNDVLRIHVRFHQLVMRSSSTGAQALSHDRGRSRQPMGSASATAVLPAMAIMD